MSPDMGRPGMRLNTMSLTGDAKSSVLAEYIEIYQIIQIDQMKAPILGRQSRVLTQIYSIYSIENPDLQYAINTRPQFTLQGILPHTLIAERGQFMVVANMYSHFACGCLPQKLMLHLSAVRYPDQSEQSGEGSPVQASKASDRTHILMRKVSRMKGLWIKWQDLQRHKA